MLGHAPMNRFMHILTFPSANFRDVVRPNFDTLYSVAWLDLTKELIIISASETGGRYYMLPMLDLWAVVFANSGNRSTGTKEEHFDHRRQSALYARRHEESPTRRVGGFYAR